MLKAIIVATAMFWPLLCWGQQPVPGSDAAAIGLQGAVHTVITEVFDKSNDASTKPTQSTTVIYDPKGFKLEEYRYDADGSLHSHAKYTRDGWKVFKLETKSIVPNENRTFVQSFDANGLVSENTTYDGSGAVLSHTKNNFAVGSPTVTSQEMKAEDGASTRMETIETIDTVTGVSHQSTTKDGKPYSDWLIQRDSKGAHVADALRFSDGSFNEREVKPDGSTVEHRYWAPTKTDTHQTTDTQNRVLEVIDESPGGYTKTTFQYDAAGRQTEIENYDRSGKLTQKAVTEYRDDGSGNWIEQREYSWNYSMASKPPKLAVVTRRTITYY